MKNRICIIPAAAMLFFAMILPVQAGDPPPNWHSIRVDDRYEDSPWEETNNTPGDSNIGSELISKLSNNKDSDSPELSEFGFIFELNIFFGWKELYIIKFDAVLLKNEINHSR